jgi:hypothetical protein
VSSGPDPENAAAPPPAPRKPSLAFSWATLGFLLGALFVILLPPPDRRRQPEPPAPSAVEPAAPKPLPPLRLTTIESVFEGWSQYAEWTDDTTEVALFDTDTNQYDDCYQIVRAANGVYFYRSIPRLDRPIKDHGVPENAPLEFTETEEQREQWLHAVDQENAKAFRKSLGLPGEGNK